MRTIILGIGALALLGGCVAHEYPGTRNLACGYGPDCYYVPGSYYGGDHRDWRAEERHEEHEEHEHHQW